MLEGRVSDIPDEVPRVVAAREHGAGAVPEEPAVTLCLDKGDSGVPILVHRRSREVDK